MKSRHPGQGDPFKDENYRFGQVFCKLTLCWSNGYQRHWYNGHLRRRLGLDFRLKKEGSKYNQQSSNSTMQYMRTYMRTLLC